MGISGEIERSVGRSLARKRSRLFGSVVFGAALGLALLSVAWACTLHSGAVFVPLEGPPGTVVGVGASTYSVTFNGTRNIYIDGPVTHAGAAPLAAVAPQICDVIPPTNSDAIGTITYTNGVGRGLATIPSQVNGTNVAHGERYEICAAPSNTGGPGASYPAWEMFTIVKL